MPTVTVTGWTGVPGAQGYYGFAGPAPGLYPYRSAGPTGSPPVSITVPTDGVWYAAVAGFVVIDGVEVMGPYSEPIAVNTAQGPTGVLTLMAA